MNIPNIYKKIRKTYLKRRYESSPYTEKNDDLKCIFVHIPKCAGISIEKSIFEGVKPGHNSVVNYKYYNPYKFWRYFTFTFVRNPIDRFESAFAFLKQGGRNKKDKEWSIKHLGNMGDIEELIRHMRQKNTFKKKIIGHQHFAPQVSFLLDIDEQIPLDYIGSVENIQEDFELICRQIGLDKSLPHKNKSKSLGKYKVKKESSKSYIKKTYKRDFEILGYT